MHIEMFFLPLMCFGIITEGVIGFSVSVLIKNKHTKLHGDAVDEEFICHTPTCNELAQSIQYDKNGNVDPCTDFYKYITDNWKSGISADQLRLSGMNLLQYKTYHRIHKLLIKKDNNDNVPFVKLAKKFHRSCINEDAIKTEGFKSIKFLLNATGGWPMLMSKAEWYKKNYTWQTVNDIYARLYGLNSFINLDYTQDPENADRYILMMDQFLRDPFDDTLKVLKDEIHRRQQLESMIAVVRAFAANERKNISMEKLRADAQDVIKFQIRLTIISSQRAEKYEQTTKRMTIEELQNFYDLIGTKQSSAQINWLDMMQFILKDVNVSINASEPILVHNPSDFHNLARLLDATPQHIIVNYIQWNIVTQYIEHLTKHIRNITYGYSSDYDEQEERWLTCVKDSPMTDILSYIFIKRYISASTLKTVSEMTNEIKAELQERILLSPWLRDNTKNYMTDTIDRISVQIGYPKGYINRTVLFERYKGLKIGKKYIKNLLAIRRYEAKKSFIAFATRKRISKTTNDWPIYPIAVNAMYNHATNLMVVPAALIQNPYFMPDTPLAVNYGAIGSIIAHELAHSCGWEMLELLYEVDSLGYKILHIGDKMAYVKRSMCFVEQYNNFTLSVTDGKRKSIKDGYKTMNENIADFIGIEAAFAAFRKKEAKTGPQPRLPTFMNITDEQLFFLSFANIMFASARGTQSKNITLNLEHSPTQFRINGSLTNVEFFSEAFNCPVGSPMNPILKCKIWN